MDRDKHFAELMDAYHKLQFDPSTGEVYSKQLDKQGREIVDPTPMAPPVGYKRQPSLAETIRKMVRDERLAQDLAAQGVETFEESDDFDVGDDYDPASPWENDFDPPIKEVVRVVEEEKNKSSSKAKSAPPETDKASEEASAKTSGPEKKSGPEENVRS